ncbi:MAG: phosphatase PAP2 family protein, partial [Ignavibacteria bacterium]
YIYTGLITLIFKSLFGRWRPFTQHGDFSFYGLTWGPNEQLSFSSGHASVAFALSCVLAGAANNIYLKILCYLLAVITALSRIYHDQHWLSDVIMGSFIGILISTMLILMHKEKNRE